MVKKLLNFWKKFDLNTKKKFFFISIITFFISFFELLGLSLVIPLLDLFIGNKIHANLDKFFNILNLNNDEYLIFIFFIFFFN